MNSNETDGVGRTTLTIWAITVGLSVGGIRADLLSGLRLESILADTS